MQKFEIILTFKCNWFCDYCAVNTHNNNITSEEVIKKLNNVPENSEVTISGGEVGLLDEDLIVAYLKILNDKNCLINLNTNGLFIKRYKHLIEIFNKINYHCSENLSADDKILEISHKNVDYILIVNDINIKNLNTFLLKHKKMFTIIPATTPVTGIQDAPTLSKSNSINILKKYNKFLSKESKKYLLLGKNYNDTIFI